ncbi:Bug family tripartite tricarboxylate transporter substrate binding protein [Hydrogenophaga sp. BPS33]|uniref:Bug family tripartite tricarboxylate transporter substrate binding protein n=1 Tax=Hydrogenophaga sp. BPS33 TaxID=2651974 RepID=UPI00131F65DC|nr:tripartite tricarboxylate transporter substrate binding protein [Hydrogenophaga sp. BPS33]QHE83716.1 tripartite tricarboxylate transporter substrate binding protein [Hydrogenophaga sp. BPS33]
MNIRRIFAALASLVLLLAGGVASAAFPDRPIRLVVPSGAGGVTDSLARSLALIMSKNMGQQVYVENRAGASGIIGSQVVATAPPDGYTLLMAFPSHVVNPSLFTKIPYDTVSAFTPVSLVSNVSMVFLVKADSPAKTLEDFIELAKAHPGKLNYASVGAGSLGHLGAEMFNSMAGTRVVHIPYKGSPQATNAMLAGDIDMYLVASASSVMPQIRAGTVRPLGVSIKTRLPVLPDVPTMSESLPGYDVGGWNGILAPAGTPADIVNRLQSEIAKAVNTPEFKEVLTREGASGVASTPAELDRVIKSDIERWAKVLKSAGVKPE